MSLLDKASLIVTPNAYKESKLYSVVPNTTLGDMDVVRATTATRVNSAGLIEVVPRNLLTYSEQFENANWEKTNVTITANTTIAPNGSTTADTITSNSAAEARLLQVKSAVSSAVYTASLFVKKDNNETRFPEFYLRTESTTYNEIHMQLNTKTGASVIRFSAGTGSQSVESFGDYWRIKITLTNTSDNVIIFGIRPAVTNVIGTYNPQIGSIIAWGAQIEEVSTATEYFPTTTRLNIPRIDYTNGSCPSLLVEPQRTNLILYSEEFNNASWFKSQSSITANSINSPSGNLTADTFIANGTSNTHSIATNSTSFISGTTYAMSVFVKKNTNNFIQFVAPFGVGGMFANFDLNNGVVGTVGTSSGSNPTSSIQNYGDGWYKCNMTFVSTATISSGSSICLVASASAIRAESNSLSTSVYLWGAQIEAGSYPTSYIPTVASTVTRNADVISKTGITDLIGQTEGTLFYDLVFPQKTNASYIGISNGTTANRIILGAEGGGFNLFGYGTGTALSLITNTRYKIALAYNSTNMLIYVNGILTNTVPGTVPSGLSRLGLDSGSGTQNLISSVNTIAIWKTRLTNTELAQLTTL